MNRLTSVIPASKARSDFYTLLNQVSNQLKRFTITRRGEAQVVMMHPDEVASWEETMDVLADKKLTADIIQSEKERKSGKVISEKKLLKELGIFSAELKDEG